MKKVLIVTTISGFLSQFERNDVKILEESDCQIHYASNFNNPVYEFDKKEWENKGVILHHIDIEKSPTSFFSNIKATIQIRNIIEKNDIELLHCHNPMGGVCARIASILAKRTPYVIYTAHGFHFYNRAPLINWLLFYPVEKFLARFTDQIITINREDYEIAKAFKKKSNGNAANIHSVGVDANRFRPHKETGDVVRKELNIPENAFHMINAAELNDNKNQIIVIDALARLNNENVYFSICGKGENKEKLEKYIEKKGLSNNVRLLGYRNDMERVLQSGDCFVFPSKREGLGVAAVEALLCGLPLIVSDNRGTKEYAVHRVNSYVCNVKDVNSFVKAIKLFEQNREKLKEMSENCRNSARYFKVDEVEKTMKKVYEKALSKI
ncbi:Glycosyltransferase involved in cell wall bisynthesis [Acetitomaculum ruminis DSM 5522]|uniref:Glycosyltransferase involved in cell wall bisynthesis n=1 Tax=Acetitomaculum ruminis DSM 5522 TaxID=1120918 RepID=A0A1I0VM63_9FIRM|nr:glycosyltransferase family 4 protein [Acetitomaculum ruminis]SFA76676.1 Glycosyltransferase involved in cell wall bisynthesis [Acetitomaculum ruminis DSM 5522]